MKQDQEQRIHVCRFCKQSFSNGKKLGGHMRGHLALISASRKRDTRENDQESINGEKNHVMKENQRIDQGFHANGRKQSIQELINGGKGLDEDDDELIENIQQGMDFDQDYDTISIKQGIEEYDHDVTNGDNGLDFDDDYDEKKSQQEVDFDQNYANVYVLRENPKKSWRVSNSNLNSKSSKAFASHKRCQSRKESIKNTVCEKCGKGFDSMKALYGHMRCHSIKRSRPLDESSALSSSEEHEGYDDGVANPVRKKRSCTRYKSPKPNHLSTSFDSSNDDEVQGALNLMMLSRGVRTLDEINMVIQHGYSRTVEKIIGFEDSEMGLKKELIDESGLGQSDPSKVGSTIGKSKSTKKPKSTDQDFTDSEILVELKRKSKDHKCPICFKGYVSLQGLARHERAHIKIESKVENDHIHDIHSVVDIKLEGGINEGDVGTKNSLRVSYSVLKQ